LSSCSGSPRKEYANKNVLELLNINCHAICDLLNPAFCIKSIIFSGYGSMHSGSLNVEELAFTIQYLLEGLTGWVSNKIPVVCRCQE